LESRGDEIMRVRDAEIAFDMARGVSRVLDDVDLDVRRGEILGVVGESGSGKSMFASALLDAVVQPGVLTGEITYRPDEDTEIDVLGLNEDELRSLRWEEVSMVFQGAMSSFNPTITIRAHFKETIRAHGADMDARMAHARELLSELYLEPDRVLDSHPHELSGGMKQRALIALSLVLEPSVLVMDEPTAALDLLMQQSILTLLENLKDRYDLTIVFITHDLPLVAGLADRLAVMYAFDFVEVGPTATILEEPTHPYTRALLNAVPDLTKPLSEMETIEGSSPDPVAVPDGCSYHPRCPLADEKCRAVDPSMYDAGPGQTVACHHWEQSVEEIPLAIGMEGEAALSVLEGQQSDEPVVSLDGVEVHFEEGGSLLNPFAETRTVHAVDDVTLDVYENDVVTLVGESGCGKTTLGKTAIAAQRPTGGTVSYRGQDVWEAKDLSGEVEVPFGEIRRALQMIHQDPGGSLNPHHTVRETLAMPLKHWRPDMNRAERDNRLLRLLERVGITPPEDYADRYPHQLSGGEKQRVALIRALLMNPDLILADEAVSALDVSLRVETMDLMLDLQEMFDTSYLFVSHNLANARYFSGNVGGRIAVMYLGEIVEIGPAEEVVQTPKHPYTQVLKWATTDLDPDAETSDPPIRGIDIPDPVDPPGGCRFHTRCPYAREACVEESPDLGDDGGDDAHHARCFRESGDDHPYWDSDPLEGAVEEDLAPGTVPEDRSVGD
jgi:peptide/nickel transport system ATP-binding protein